MSKSLTKVDVLKRIEELSNIDELNTLKSTLEASMEAIGNKKDAKSKTVVKDSKECITAITTKLKELEEAAAAAAAAAVINVGDVLVTDYPATLQVVSISDREILTLDITDNGRNNGIHYAFLPFNKNSKELISSVNKKEKEGIIEIK